MKSVWKMDKIRIMFYADAYNATSGYSKVARELANRIQADDRFEVIFQELVTNQPMTIVNGVTLLPAFIPRNEKAFMNVLINNIRIFAPDILFPISDVFLLHRDGMNRVNFSGVKLLPYLMIDSDNLPDVADTILDNASFVVTGSEHGKNMLASGGFDSQVLFHGVDFESYKPIKKSEQEALRDELGIPKDKKLFLTVGRNFIRKRHMRLIEAIARYNKAHPDNDSYFLFHIGNQDDTVWNIPNFIEMQEAKYDVSLSNLKLTEEHSTGTGISEQSMVKMYQACDYYITASAGEGFGFPIVESMACGKVVVAPDNTTHKAFLAEDRGILVGNEGFVNTGYGTSCPVVDIDKLAQEIYNVSNMSPQEYSKKSSASLAYVRQNCNWDIIAEELKEVFLKNI